MGDFTCTHTHTDTQAYRAISSPKWQSGSCLTPIDMPRGAQVNIGSVFFCLLFGYRLWLSRFFFHLQSQHSLWDGNCSSRMKTLSCVFNCCIWETYMTVPARTVTPPHKRSDISSVFQALMTMKLHFLAVIVDVYFPLLSLKIMFVTPRGLPIVLSASPLCMTALCRRCSTKQPHWNAANASPLWHKTHFYRHLFLHSSEYNQKNLSGLGLWLMRWM